MVAMNESRLWESITDTIAKTLAEAAHDCADGVVYGPLAGHVQRRRCANEARRHAKEFCDELRRAISLIREAAEVADEDARLLATLVDFVVSCGIRPSSRELREVLLPVIDSVPGMPDAPMGFRLVLRELGRFRARRAPESRLNARSTPHMQTAAQILGGRSMLFIGGRRRTEAERDLEGAFGLRELIWLETRPHQSIYDFEPFVKRGDVAVVALLIRWSSHCFRQIRKICDRYGKLLIRVPGGYNKNQIASQIIRRRAESV
jgi:hypothetical protein